MHSKNIAAQLDAHLAKRLRDAWGGRLPTWDEFKTAKRSGIVQANKSVAMHFGRTRPVPAAFRVLYGVLTPTSVFLFIPAALVYWLGFGGSFWWLIASFAATSFMYKVTLEGNCEGIKEGAVRDRQFYEHLVSRGAFMFERTETPIPPISTTLAPRKRRAPGVR